jgi:hypothetical protein
MSSIQKIAPGKSKTKTKQTQQIIAPLIKTLIFLQGSPVGRREHQVLDLKGLAQRLHRFVVREPVDRAVRTCALPGARDHVGDLRKQGTNKKSEFGKPIKPKEKETIVFYVLFSIFGIADQQKIWPE